MEPLILITADQLRAIIEVALEEVNQKLDSLLTGTLQQRMISAKQAAQRLGKTNSTICRWCRGVKVGGETIVLNHQRLPNGQYLIDERDLLTFSQQISRYYNQAEEPVETAPPTWALTRTRKNQ